MTGIQSVLRELLWAGLRTGFAFLLIAAIPSQANVLPFTGPWVVTLGPKAGDAKTAFGQDAVNDGDVLNTTALIGVGKASAVTPSALPGSSATSSTKVTFFRPFTLPPGATYTLKINGSLFGSLFTLVGPTDTAGVSANVFIEVQNGPLVLNLSPSGGLAFDFDAPTPTAKSISIDTGVISNQTAIGAIAPGDYDIFGSLSVFASTSLSLSPLTNALAELFTAGLSIGGAVDVVRLAPPPPAAPAPEPPVVPLFITAALGILAC